MGIGALNEIIEYVASVYVPQNGVGDYNNTIWDIIYNTIGASFAVIYINFKRRKEFKN